MDRGRGTVRERGAGGVGAAGEEAGVAGYEGERGGGKKEGVVLEGSGFFLRGVCKCVSRRGFVWWVRRTERGEAADEVLHES